MTDPEQARIVKDLMDEYTYREQSQFSWKSRIESWWRRWHADPTLVLPNRNDPNWQLGTGDAASQTRPKLKDWQHYILNPHGFVNERAQTTAMVNLICEASPMFKARGYHEEDIPTESPLESLDNYHFAVLNPAIEWIGDTFTRGFIQGIAPLKAAYVNDSYPINILPRAWDIKRFESGLKAARDVIEEERARGDKEAQDPPGIRPDGTAAVDDAAMGQFSQWAGSMKQKYGVNVPMPPVGMKRRMYRDVGLKLAHIELFDLLWDPKIPTMRDQRRVFQRMVADKRAVLERAKKENERARFEKRPEPFNLRAIATMAEGITFQGSSMSATNLQERLMQLYGINTSQTNDPSMKHAVEIIEAWEPSTGTWCWIGQRQDALTNYGCYPLMAPVHPYAAFINIPTPGQLVGKSHYDIHAPSHEHLDTMRGYIADYYALMVGQPLARTTLGGMGDTGRKLEIRPFETFDAEPGEEYKTLYDFSSQLDGALQYSQLLKGELDQGMAIDDVTRGQSAQINRVGVGEVQLRAQNQQNRQRFMLYTLSTMCSRDLIPLGNLLIYQFGDPEHIRQAAGGMPFEPEEMMASENLWPGLMANHMVMPTAMMAEAALAIQQIQETMKVAGSMGILVQGGKAALAFLSRLMSMQRMQGVEQVIQLATQDLDEAKKAADSAGQLQKSQADLAAVQKQADALRLKLGIPSAEELNAEIQVIEAEKQAADQAAQQAQSGEVPKGMPALPPGQVIQ